MASRKAARASTKHSLAFDDRNLRWHKLGDLQHFVFYVFDVDSEKGLVDFILKFEPNERIILHRHLTLTNTFVVQGSIVFTNPMAPSKRFVPSAAIPRVHRVNHIVKVAAIRNVSSFTASAERRMFCSNYLMTIATSSAH